MADRRLVGKLLSLIAPKEREKQYFESMLRKILYSLYLESKYEEAKEAMNFDDMYEKYVDIYTKSLDDETVSALIQFCQSEAGIQWILNMPTINSHIELIKGDFIKNITTKLVGDVSGLPKDIDHLMPNIGGGDIN